MAKKSTKKAEPQAQQEEPKLATTEQGEAQAAAAEEEPKLKKAEAKRYDELAQSGYSIPKAWAADGERRQAHDEAIAQNQPSTRPDRD